MVAEKVERGEEEQERHFRSRAVRKREGGSKGRKKKRRVRARGK